MGKICQQPIKAGRNSIKCKISKPLFGMFKPVANQAPRLRALAADLRKAGK